MYRKVIVATVLASVLATAGCASQSDGDAESTLRLSHSGTSGSGDIYDQYSEKFAEQVAKATKDRVKVEVYGNGELYDDFVDATTAVVGGDIDLAITSVSGSYPEIGVPEGSVAGAPRMFDSDKDYLSWLEADDGYKQIEPLLEKKGITELDNFPLGKQYLYTKNEIRSIDDFKGLTMRAGGEGTMAFLKAIGASPSNMSIGETYGGLQQGVLDGVVTGIDAYDRNKFYEVAPHVTADNYLFSMYNVSLIQNKESWEGLTPGDRAAIEDNVLPQMHKWVLKEVEKTWSDSMEEVAEESKWSTLDQSTIDKLDSRIETKVFPIYSDISKTADSMLKSAKKYSK